MAGLVMCFFDKKKNDFEKKSFLLFFNCLIHCFRAVCGSQVPRFTFSIVTFVGLVKP